MNDASLNIGLVSNGQTGDCQAGLVCHGDSGFLGMGVSKHQCSSPTRLQCFKDIFANPECGVPCLPLCLKDKTDKADFAKWKESNDLGVGFCSSRCPLNSP